MASEPVEYLLSPTSLAAKGSQRMNILFPSHRPDDAFLVNLATGLRRNPAVDLVDISLDRFWAGWNDGTDVLHIHWPEALFEWREPTPSQLQRLTAKLQEWKSRAVIVATVHNSYPHYRASEAFYELYQIVYRAAHGIIHLGSASIRDLRRRHPTVGDTPSAVIPIPEYSVLFGPPLEIGEARDALGVPQRALVCLAFGRLRHDQETALLLGGFRGLKAGGKRLMIVGFMVPPQKAMLRLWRRIILRFHPRISTHLSPPVPSEQVTLYASAADVVVIPRYAVLNSGNVPLGFMFGKVVVGPDSGVVGEILRETGNPVFVPGDRASLAAALNDAKHLVAEGKGEWNRQYSAEHWNLTRISEEHVTFYQEVARTKKYED